MKKIVAAVVTVLVVCAAGFAAWQGYRAVFTEPEAYYAQVDADKLTSAGENNNDFDCHYDLPAVSATGEEKELGFDTSRELRDGAYLKLETLAMRGVTGWEEVSWDEIPAAAQDKLPAPAASDAS